MNVIHLPRARLVIVCGLPGAGKTTYARQMEEQGAIRFCADEWMDALSLDHYDEDKRHKIEALQWKRAKQLLEHGLTVIIEWGTWSRAERDGLRLQAQKLGAAAELHYLTAPLDVLFHRVQRRRREHPPITREHLTEWSRKFQAPDSREMAMYDTAIVIPADEPATLPTREKVAVPMRRIAGEEGLA